MKYTDRVYGNLEIDEPVILELINSKTLHRLKDIDQAGYFEPHFPGTAHSRNDIIKRESEPKEYFLKFDK